MSTFYQNLLYIRWPQAYLTEPRRESKSPRKGTKRLRGGRWASRPEASPRDPSGVVLYHCVTEKKRASVTANWSAYSGSWRHIKQPYVGGFSRSPLECDFSSPPVRSFCCFILIFSFVMISMKNFETYTIDRYYWKKHLRFFSRIFYPYAAPETRFKV